MPSRARTLPRMLAPLALMALVFFLSAQPNLGTDLGLIDLIGRKIVHAGVYATLTLLWWWAFMPLTAWGASAERGEPGGQRRTHTTRAALAAAALISFLYAVSDEFHQTFTDGRSGSPIDVGIDTAGIIFACWLVASGHAGNLLTRRQRSVTDSPE